MALHGAALAQETGQPPLSTSVPSTPADNSPAGVSPAGQPAAAPAPDAIADIVVTAQKRSESVQSIPLAVTAIGGAGLQERGATTLSALSSQVPSFNVSEQVGQARLTLRGIGVDNIDTGAESSVAFNQDGIFYSRSAAALASFYDVARVEVLRGPQGTLYGRNATGGSVNIITNHPSETLHGGLAVTGGNDTTINSEGFLTGPLSNTLSARVSFQTQHHSGYGENLVTGHDIDTKDSQAVRGQLLFKPDDRLSVLLAADYYRSHDRSNEYHYFGPGGETATGQPITPTALLLGGYAAPDIRDVATEADPRARAQFYGTRLDIGYKLSDTVSLRSLTAWRHERYLVDTTASPFSVEVFPLSVFERSNQYTQEFQLNVDTSRNKFVAGVFYLHETIDGMIYAPVNLAVVGGPSIFTQGFLSAGQLKTDAAAVYAQDSYSLRDNLRLTLGGRFSYEHKHVDDQSGFDLSQPFSTANFALVPHHVDGHSFKAFTPKIGIDYDVAPGTLLYASYSKGFKSGTYNLGSGGPPLKPEKVDAYEAGLKTTFADGRLRANLAGFYYSYKDLQVGKVQDQLVVLENAASARIYGIEGEFTARPVNNLTLTLNASWLHARFSRYITADQARPGGDGVTVDDNGLPAFNLHGNELPQAPNYTVNVAGEYVIHLHPGSLRLRGESVWTDRVYFSGFDRKNVSQAPYNLQNAFATYEDASGHWRLSLYVKNIADKTIKSAGQVASSLFGSPIVGFVYPPRTYGATVGYSF